MVRISEWNLSPWPDTPLVGVTLEGLPPGCDWWGSVPPAGDSPVELGREESARLRWGLQVKCGPETVPGVYQLEVWGTIFQATAYQYQFYDDASTFVQLRIR